MDTLTATDNGVLDTTPAPEVTFTKEELQSRLTEQQYNVTQNKGTER